MRLEAALLRRGVGGPLLAAVGSSSGQRWARLRRQAHARLLNELPARIETLGSLSPSAHRRLQRLLREWLLVDVCQDGTSSVCIELQ